MAPNSAFDPQTDQPYKPGPTSLENPMYDRLRTPRPPNERGWVSDPIGDAIRRLDDADHARRELAQFNEYPIGVVVSGPFKGLIAFEVRSELADWLGSCMQSALSREPNPEERATDATFENETRPHR
jgi:hypothetical protein